MISRHAGDHHAHRLTAHQRGVTAEQRPVHRGLQVGDRRRHEQRSSGTA